MAAQMFADGHAFARDDFQTTELYRVKGWKGIRGGSGARKIAARWKSIREQTREQRREPKILLTVQTGPGGARTRVFNISRVMRTLAASRDALLITAVHKFYNSLPADKCNACISVSFIMHALSTVRLIFPKFERSGRWPLPIGGCCTRIIYLYLFSFIRSRYTDIKYSVVMSWLLHLSSLQIT